MEEKQIIVEEGRELTVHEVKTGASQYGDWQLIKVASPNGKTHGTVFCDEVYEWLHDGDIVKIEHVKAIFANRRTSPGNPKPFETQISLRCKLSLVGTSNTFDTTFQDVDTKDLPF